MLQCVDRSLSVRLLRAQYSVASCRDRVVVNASRLAEAAMPRGYQSPNRRYALRSGQWQVRSAGRSINRAVARRFPRREDAERRAALRRQRVRTNLAHERIRRALDWVALPPLRDYIGKRGAARCVRSHYPRGLIDPSGSCPCPSSWVRTHGAHLLS